MNFIEMSGRTLKQIVSEDELQAIELGDLGVTDESMVRKPIARAISKSAAKAHVGRDRRPVGRFRPSRAPRNRPRLGRLLRLRTRGRCPHEVGPFCRNGPVLITLRRDVGPHDGA